MSTPLQVNSSFGYRWGRKHTGIDFQASWGESVGVSVAGTVTFAGMKHGYGNLVIVDHGEGISTYYAHLSSIYVGVGQTVETRQVIGAIGTTGRSTGPAPPLRGPDQREADQSERDHHPRRRPVSRERSAFRRRNGAGRCRALLRADVEPRGARSGKPPSPCRPSGVVDGDVLLYSQNSLSANF